MPYANYPKSAHLNETTFLECNLFDGPTVTL